MRLLIMGAPGAGKGTQGPLLAKRLGIPAISTGAIFRDHVQRGTQIGHKVEQLIDAGDFVPDDIVEEIVAERLSRPDVRAGFLLDGFPRTIHQAGTLDAILLRSHLTIDHVISLVVDNELLVERMLGRAVIEGRADDNERTIRHRMAVYHKATEPLLALYRERNQLVEVDGVGTVEEIQKRIFEGLNATYDDGA